GLVTSLGNQAAIFVERGDAPTALRLLDGQLAAAAEAGLSAQAVNSLSLQMRIRPAFGDMEGLQRAVASAEESAARRGDRYLLAQCLAMRGTMAMGRPQAPGLLADAEAMARETGNPHALQLSAGNRGLMLIQAGDLDG